MSFGISPTDLERFIIYCRTVQKWCSSETVSEYKRLQESANYIASLQDKIRLAYSGLGGHQPAVKPLLKGLDDAMKEVQSLLKEYQLSHKSSLTERARFSIAAQKRLAELMDRCKTHLESLYEIYSFIHINYE